MLNQSYAVDIDDSLFEGSVQEEEAAREKVGGVYVRFHHQLVENKVKSWGGIVVDEHGNEKKVKGEGRPIFDEIEYVEIITPGDRTNIPDRKVTDEDRKKYAAQYRRWKSGTKQAASGTPLSAWPRITRARVEELAYFNVRTVEELAAVSDGNAQSMGIGTLTEIKEAKDFLALAKGTAPIAALRNQLAQRESQLEVATRTIAALEERVAAMEDKQKGKQEPEEVAAVAASEEDEDAAAAAVVAAATQKKAPRTRKAAT